VFKVTISASKITGELKIILFPEPIVAEVSILLVKLIVFPERVRVPA